MATTYDSAGYPKVGGYAGRVISSRWAKMARDLGADYAVKGAADFDCSFLSTPDRTVQIAVGEAFGRGIHDIVTGDPVNVTLGTVASGSRWDLVCIRRNWASSPPVTTITSVAGTTTAAVVPTTRNANPGTLDDQPLWLVQVTAGQTQPTAKVDLRSRAAKIVSVVDGRALVDARLGDIALISGSTYRMVLDGVGNLVWKAESALTPGAGFSWSGTSTAVAQGWRKATYFSTTDLTPQGGMVWTGGATCEMTIPADGMYAVATSSSWAASTSARRGVGVYVNGNLNPPMAAVEVRDASQAGTGTGIVASAVMPLAAGDRVALAIFHDSPTAQSPAGGSLSVIRVV